jgi:UDPglucose 6-dehydrogenase
VYLCEHFGLPEVASYWEAVVKMNDWQKHRFAARIVRSLFNTVADKKIAVFGFAFKKDTNDTRESPAITVCRDLLAEQARVVVYDPKVPAKEIRAEILGKDPSVYGPDVDTRLAIASSADEAATDAHAVAVLTEWDEFKSLDYGKIFASMCQPASLFDGRNILDLKKLAALGFRTHAVGK